MNIKQAYRLGVASGLEAAEFGDFTPEELETKDAFLEACSEICDNKRQYAGHAAEDFNRYRNSEGLWDNFEDGETVGILKGWLLRQKHKRVILGSISKLVLEAAPTCGATDSAEDRYRVWLDNPTRVIKGRSKRELRENLLKEFGITRI